MKSDTSSIRLPKGFEDKIRLRLPELYTSAQAVVRIPEWSLCKGAAEYIFSYIQIYHLHHQQLRSFFAI
jgi:hypothetical protein